MISRKSVESRLELPALMTCIFPIVVMVIDFLPKSSPETQFTKEVPMASLDTSESEETTSLGTH